MADETKSTQENAEQPAQTMWLRNDRAGSGGTDASVATPAGAEAVWAAAKASQLTKPDAPPKRPLLSDVIDERDGGKSTYFFGRVLPMPLYTVIFGTLAVITLVEVILSELPESIIWTVLLVILSVAKAVLVILFYMHLRNDSRIFFAALLLPLIVAIIATMFLLAVPTTGYSY